MPLASEDIWRIIEALDSREYRQLSEPTWRHSGAVILPSDDQSLWEDRPEPTGEERATISEIARCRELADRLRSFAVGE